MMSNNDLSSMIDLQQQASQYLIQGNYLQAIDLYEQAIANDSANQSYYWHLGLMLLLQEREEEAQTTWLLGIAIGESEEIDQYTEELIQVLEAEVNRRTVLEDFSVAWAIRQHIREIQPTNISNLLLLIDISMILDTYTEEQLADYDLITQLQNAQPEEINSDLMLHIFKKLLISVPTDKSSLEFAEVCAKYVREPKDFVNMVIPFLYDISYSFGDPRSAINYAEICLSLNQKNQEVIRAIAQFSTDINNYCQGVEYAKKSYSMSEKLNEKIFDNHMVVRALMAAGGYNEEVKELIEKQKSLLRDLIIEQPKNLGTLAMRLYNSSFFFPYVQDHPSENVKLRAQVAQVCQPNIEESNDEEVKKYCNQRLANKQSCKSSQKILKIGYLSHCLKRHSVGWIARWLFKHHNQDRFQIYAYLLGAKNQEEPLREWYVKQATQAYKYGIVGAEVAEQIYQDEIDILIDLDSITLTNTCSIIALKPAPVQATWLGWDASGIPTIDYFIADPYVLPENAQDYYSEKILRLPQTYVAVDGFEIGVPSLCRKDLDIPDDAVVYFSAQRGPKYNPHTTSLQMKILKEVPNSYFLIKGFGEQESLDNLFINIAEQEGVASNRIKFIDRVGFEETHRANLGIADIVLDTYPYNGATTTLETLWMCIPMVTRVGQQFAARNSYTMMMNAGITEGIAWSDEEYVEWGIRLGKDEKLRQEISWKLRKSRQTAPLWNAKQFTREMERAYEQMWQRYIEGES